RRHARGARRLQDAEVVLDRLRIALAFLGLDPCPLDREPVMCEAVRRVQLEVLGVSRRESVPVTRRRYFAQPLASEPIPRRCPPLRLRRGRAGSPPETQRKTHSATVPTCRGRISSTPGGTERRSASISTPTRCSRR